MKVTLPPFLKKNAHVRIVCPSGYLPLEKALQAQKILQEWGYQVSLGHTTQTENSYFSGTDAERLSDLQAAMDDTTVDAILMGRGGYGLTRIIDSLDFKQFKRKPKWLMGFSDITVLHSHVLENYRIATLHAPMCGTFTEENKEQPFMQAYRDVLKGKPIHYKFEAHDANMLGKAAGIVAGGNLCILDHLTGSPSQVDMRNKILFIEDIGEHLYKIDRMLWGMKRSGQLADIKALICGNFTDMEDTTRPFGKDIYQIILEHVAHLGIPVAFEMPIGHDPINYPLILGAKYSLEVKKGSVVLKQV